MTARTRMIAGNALPRRGEAGIVIISVLLLLAVISTVAMSYARHAITTDRQSAASLAVVRAREAVASGVAFGQQALVVGDTLVDTTVVSGNGSAAITYTDLGNSRTLMRVDAVDPYGLGATAFSEVKRLQVADETDSDSLPRFDQATIAAVVADGSVPKTYFSGTTLLQDTDLTGLIIVQDSALLYLDNVIINGTIVSEGALSADPFGGFDSMTAPRVEISGGVRIDPGAFLPGVAVIMPDGTLTTSAGVTPGILLRGDVAAYQVSLQGQGAIKGNAASVVALDLAPAMDRPGFGRGALPWAASLDAGSHFDLTYHAFVPRPTSAAELAAIQGYDFTPEETGGGDPPPVEPVQQGNEALQQGNMSTLP